MIRITTMYKMSEVIRFIKFGIVGISNTALLLLLYYTCIYIGFSYLWANTIAWIISIFNAYYWNNKYVFNSHRSWKEKLVKTYCAYGISYSVSMALLYVFVDILRITDKIAPLLVLIITVPLNYILNRFWSFKK